MKKKAIIVDIDGTLALFDRDPYATELSRADKINKPVAEIIRILFEVDYQIILVTGREEIYRGITEAWLLKNLVPYTELLMRPMNNRDVTGIELKKQIYNGYIYPKYDVLFAMEDMFKVAEMYREQGVPCFQVDKERFLKEKI